MNKLAVITVIEFKLFFRNFFNVFFALAFPVGMLLLFGGIYGNKPVEYLGGHGMVDVSTPAYSCMVIAVTGLMSLPLTVAQYREKKILKRFMATPVNPADILISQVFVNFIMTILGMVALIVVGKIVFDLHFFGRILPTVFSFFLVTLCLFSLGLLIAGVSPNGKTANVIAYLVYFPMLFLSGATLPIEMMPEGIKNAARVLPLTYGVKLLTGVWLGDKLSAHTTDIIILFCIFVVCIVISAKLFKWE